MKVITTEEGAVKTNDSGEPLYDDGNGKEVTLSAVVSSLRSQAATYRTRAKTAESKLEKAQPIMDIVTAAEVDVQDLPDRLSQNGHASDEEITRLQTKLKEERQSHADELAKVQADRNNEKIESALAKSEAIGKTIYPTAHAVQLFSKHAKVNEAGDVVGVDADGAETDLESALVSHFNADPRRDSYYKPTEEGGTGFDKGKKPTKSGVKRSDMSTVEKARYRREHGKQAYDSLPA
jgi:hypothetical protein